MDNLIKAYFVAIVFFIISLWFEMLSLLVIQLIGAFIVAGFIGKDAAERKLPGAHKWWALLGVLGVIIYHLAFALRAKK